MKFKFSFLNCCILTGLIGLFWLFVKYLFKKYQNYKNTLENKFELDKSEFPSNIDYRNSDYFKNPENVTYILWSGGFSSTFRLCQLLLLDEKLVQPIYIHTDNFGSFEKHNEMEITKMKEIRNTLYKDYPILKNRLAPTMYIKHIKRDPLVTNKFKNLHLENGFFEKDEKKDKYENIARFSNSYEYQIELPIDKDEYYLNQAIQPYLKNIYKSNTNQIKKLDIDIPVKYSNLHIFKNLLFPISHLKKDELKMIAIQNNFYYILKMTWSCCNPNIDGDACLKCPQCLKRNI